MYLIVYVYSCKVMNDVLLLIDTYLYIECNV